LSESVFASSIARSSATVGGTGFSGDGTVTGDGVTTATAGGGERSQPKIASTKHAAAASQP
jgi:hypothetical protein